MSRRVLWMVPAVVAPLLTAVVLVPVREQLSSANLALLMLAVAVAVAAAGNRVDVAVVAGAVTALCYDVFLVRPYYSITIAEPAEALTTALVLVVVIVVGVVSSLFRRQRSLTERREESLGLVYQLVDQVANASGTEALIEASAREIAELLTAEDCRYVARPANEDLDPDDLARAAGAAQVGHIGEVHVGGVLWDTTHRGLPGPLVLVPVESGGLYFGDFVITPNAGRPIDRWELVVAVMIADLVGAALARWPD